MPKNDCTHPNSIITEYLSGKATHRFKNGEHDWSDEYIAIDRIEEYCPDCFFIHVTEQGEDIPNHLAEKIEEARRMVRQQASGMN